MENCEVVINIVIMEIMMVIMLKMTTIVMIMTTITTKLGPCKERSESPLLPLKTFLDSGDLGAK